MDSRRKPRATSGSVYTPSSSGPRWQIRSSARVSQAWSGSASRASARQPAIPHIVVLTVSASWSGHRSYGGPARGGRELHTLDFLASLAGASHGRAGGALTSRREACLRRRDTATAPEAPHPAFGPVAAAWRVWRMTEGVPYRYRQPSPGLWQRTRIKGPDPGLRLRLLTPPDRRALLRERP